MYSAGTETQKDKRVTSLSVE